MCAQTLIKQTGYFLVTSLRRFDG